MWAICVWVYSGLCNNSEARHNSNVSILPSFDDLVASYSIILVPAHCVVQIASGLAFSCWYKKLWLVHFEENDSSSGVVYPNSYVLVWPQIIRRNMSSMAMTLRIISFVIQLVRSMSLINPFDILIFVNSWLSHLLSLGYLYRVWYVVILQLY